MTTTAIRTETGVATRTIRTYCAECGARCGVIATVRDGELLKVLPDRDHPNRGFCVKGEAGPEKVLNSGRLLYPVRRTNPKTADDPGWQRISWEEALTLVADNLLRLRSESGPESVAFTRPAVSGSGSVDWAHWIIRLSRAFGSPNFVSTTHICQWARDNGSAYTYGSGLPKPDYEHASTIVVWGNNPAVTEVQNWLRIRDAHNRGAKLIVIDPRRTETAAGADLWLSVTPGTDAALALGLIRLLLQDRGFDSDFAARWTNAPFLVDRATGRLLRPADCGIEASDDAFVAWDAAAAAPRALDSRRDTADQVASPELFFDRTIGNRAVASVLQLLREAVEPYTPAAVAAETGLSAAQLQAMARMLAGGGPVAYYTHNGVEQHINTMETNRALCILFGLLGHYDAPGGNVLFSGAPSNGVDGHDLLSAEAAGKRLGMEVRPLGAPRNSAQAYMFYDAVLQGSPYKARGLVAFGGNMLIQNGHTIRGREALQALDFYVHVDMFESPTSQVADVLLPAATCWESPGLTVGFGGSLETNQYVQLRDPLVTARGEARSDTQIIFDLATRLGLGGQFWDGDYLAAYQHQLAPTGLTLDGLRAVGGPVKVEARPAYRKYASRDAEGLVRGFNTPTRRMEIYSQTFLDSGLGALPSYDEPAWRKLQRGAGEDYPLILTTAKVASYVHSSGRGIPSLRRQHPEPFVELHPETAEFCGVKDRDLVDIATPNGHIRARAHVTDRVIPGVAATQTGWWEACEELDLPALDPFGPSGANLNFVVTNDLIDPISGSVPGKSYACSVRPVREQ